MGVKNLMAVTYTVAIDFNDDGDFSGAGEDITSDVREISWRLGFMELHQSVAEVAECEIVVNNQSDDYYPEKFAVVSPELLVDGDMEASGLTDWTRSVEAGATHSKVTVSPHGGSRNVKIENTVGGNSSIRQEILIVGQAYRAFGWARGDGTNAPVVYSGFAMWTGTSSTEWQFFDVTWVAIGVRMYYIKLGGPIGFVEFDDCHVQKLVVDSGFRVRIQSDDGSTVRTHYQGWIYDVAVMLGERDEQLITIKAACALRQLASYKVRPGRQVDVSAGTVINAILDLVPFRELSLYKKFLVGVVDHAELDFTTKLAEGITRSIEDGISIWEYVGDLWDEGLIALDAIRDVCDSELGRFYSDRTGQLVFIGRQHLLADKTSLLTLTTTPDALHYDYGSQVINNVELSMMPRALGALHTVLWTLNTSLRVGVDETRTISVRFTDSDNRGVGALSVDDLVAGVDYVASQNQDGSGQDRTSFLQVSVLDVGFAGLTLLIKHSFGKTLYVQPGMVLKGQPITLGDRVTISRRDPASEALRGALGMEAFLSLASDVEVAEQFGDFELKRRAALLGAVRRVELTIAQEETAVLARTVFDRITVTDSDSGHSADYFILGEDHRIGRDGLHRCQWLLEPAVDHAYWILGTSKLGTDTELAF